MTGTSDIIGLALSEDVGPGDVTVRWFTDPSSQSIARIVARQDCCLAGVGVASEVFQRVDSRLLIKTPVRDGAAVVAGDCVLSVAGATGSILTAERTALNFVQRLSGVATLTRRYVEAVAGTGVILLDTRKTTPGLRALEKAAVAAGGATNHRMGLHDMVMLKDNHLAAGTEPADLQRKIDALKAAVPGMRVEIEADTLDQVRVFATLRGVDVILLDNMSVAEIREAVRMRPRGIQFEASGGITLSSIRAIAETGVDFISIGALTHSAPAVDFSLELTAA